MDEPEVGEEEMEPSDTRRSVAAPNHMERELGKLTLEQEQKVVLVLRDFMEKVRGILHTIDREAIHANVRCSTCAFNPQTDKWKGFAPTAYGLMKSLRDIVPFICHDDQPAWMENEVDPGKWHLCQGFRSLIELDPIPAHELAIEASSALRRIVSPNHP